MEVMFSISTSNWEGQDIWFFHRNLIDERSSIGTDLKCPHS